MSVMLCTGITFVKKNSCLVAITVSFDIVGLHLLTFRILEPYSSIVIEGTSTLSFFKKQLKATKSNLK